MFSCCCCRSADEEQLPPKTSAATTTNQEENPTSKPAPPIAVPAADDRREPEAEEDGLSRSTSNVTIELPKRKRSASSASARRVTFALPPQSTGTESNLTLQTDASTGKTISSSFMLNPDTQITTTTTTTTTTISRSSSPPPAPRITLLPTARSSHIERELNSLKMDFKLLPDAVADLDFAILTQERLERLQACLPTKKEEHMIRTFVENGGVGEHSVWDSLSDSEQFIFIVSFVPCFQYRVKFLLLMMTFDATIGKIEESYQVLNRACEEVRQNASFREALSVVVSISNILTQAAAVAPKTLPPSFLSKLTTIQSAVFEFSVEYLHKKQLRAALNSPATTNKNLPPDDDTAFLELKTDLFEGFEQLINNFDSTPTTPHLPPRKTSSRIQPYESDMRLISKRLQHEFELLYQFFVLENAESELDQQQIERTPSRSQDESLQRPDPSSPSSIHMSPTRQVDRRLADWSDQTFDAITIPSSPHNTGSLQRASSAVSLSRQRSLSFSLSASNHPHPSVSRSRSRQPSFAHHTNVLEMPSSWNGVSMIHQVTQAVQKASGVQLQRLEQDRATLLEQVTSIHRGFEACYGSSASGANGTASNKPQLDARTGELAWSFIQHATIRLSSLDALAATTSTALQGLVESYGEDTLVTTVHDIFTQLTHHFFLPFTRAEKDYFLKKLQCIFTGALVDELTDSRAASRHAANESEFGLMEWLSDWHENESMSRRREIEMERQQVQQQLSQRQQQQSNITPPLNQSNVSPDSTTPRPRLVTPSKIPSSSSSPSALSASTSASGSGTPRKPPIPRQGQSLSSSSGTAQPQSSIPRPVVPAELRRAKAFAYGQAASKKLAQVWANGGLAPTKASGNKKATTPTMKESVSLARWKSGLKNAATAEATITTTASSKKTKMTGINPPIFSDQFHSPTEHLHESPIEEGYEDISPVLSPRSRTRDRGSSGGGSGASKLSLYASPLPTSPPPPSLDWRTIESPKLFTPPPLASILPPSSASSGSRARSKSPAPRLTSPSRLPRPTSLPFSPTIIRSPSTNVPPMKGLGLAATTALSPTSTLPNRPSLITSPSASSISIPFALDPSSSSSSPNSSIVSLASSFGLPPPMKPRRQAFKST